MGNERKHGEREGEGKSEREREGGRENGGGEGGRFSKWEASLDYLNF